MKVITTFSGIGMQERGIEKATDLELVATSEIDKDAVLSYAAIHKGLTMDMVKNFDRYPSKEKMVEQLKARNIGYNFEKNKPYDWDKLARRKDDTMLKKYWLAGALSRCMGDISLIKSIPSCHLLTFSFPCTDISGAGRQEGLSYEDWKNQNSTRSGLVWEIVRILEQAKEENNLPKYLLMENVPALVQKKFIKDFEFLNQLLDEIGYDCHWQLLNAKNFGVPQNRNRVFGVYIRKDLNMDYEFPEPQEVQGCLRDILDEFWNEKYIVDKPFTWLDKTRTKNVIATNKPPYRKIGQRDQIYNENGIMGALVATDFKQPRQILTNCYQIAQLDIKGMDCLKRVYSTSGQAPTLTTMGGGNTEPKIIEERTQKELVRKLTPKECFALMGMTKEDCQKCYDMGLSDTQLYKQAGNGLVTTVITALIEKLLEAEEKVGE